MTRIQWITVISTSSGGATVHVSQNISIFCFSRPAKLEWMREVAIVQAVLGSEVQRIRNCCIFHRDALLTHCNAYIVTYSTFMHCWRIVMHALSPISHSCIVDALQCMHRCLFHIHALLTHCNACIVAHFTFMHRWRIAMHASLPISDSSIVDALQCMHCCPFHIHALLTHCNACIVASFTCMHCWGIAMRDSLQLNIHLARDFSPTIPPSVDRRLRTSHRDRWRSRQSIRPSCGRRFLANVCHLGYTKFINSLHLPPIISVTPDLKVK